MDSFSLWRGNVTSPKKSSCDEILADFCNHYVGDPRNSSGITSTWYHFLILNYQFPISETGLVELVQCPY
eukprot:UN27233